LTLAVNPELRQPNKLRALIQQKGGRFPNVNYYNAALGFEELGWEVVLVDEAELAARDGTREALVVGEIPVTLAAFARRRVAYEPFSYIPEVLLPFAGRRIWSSTLGEVRNRVAAGQALFAKPLEGTPRLFKGQILRAYRDLITTANCDASTAVWCSDLVDFVSEYRVFLCQGAIVGIKHYFGDFRLFVDWHTVENAVACLQPAAAGFAVDFGVANTGETRIVEQNDGFSLGSYGLHHVTYAKLLEARSEEIVGT
jgi:hypothetical protein